MPTRRRTVRRHRNPNSRAEGAAQSTMLAIFSAQQRLEKAMENFYALQDEVEGEGHAQTRKMKSLWTRINRLIKATKDAKKVSMDVQDDTARMAGAYR